jgi:hypothetical protein
MAGLPSFPDLPLIENTTGISQPFVTAFDREQVPYDWEASTYQRPKRENLVIYELLIRDFLHDHNYQSLTDTLDYFERLGVNAIELMPVNEFEGNISWGYNPSFHMAVDKYYGSGTDLKRFIDEAHKRNIAVILDVVFNHCFSQSPFFQLYWDNQLFRPSPDNPWLNVVPRHPFNVGFDFNHESPFTKRWVKHVLGHWITEYRFDGFRFDLSKGLTQFYSGNNADLMAQYDAGRIAIIKDYADHIWSQDSTAYVILEHFAYNDEEIELSDYGMMLWGNMNHQFNEAAMGYRSDLEGADYTFRGWNEPHLIAYMESHDEERLMYRLLNYGDSDGDYNTRELTTALQRIETASAIFYSIPGPKMLWQFGELGYDFPINYCEDGTINNNCRLDPKPIRWDYLLDYRREHLRKVIEALLHLRNSYPTFSTEDFIFRDGNYFLKTVHLNHPEMDAAVLANFRVVNSDVNPLFQYPGTWYEYFTGDSLEVTDTQEKITFGPGEYRIYTSKRIVPPGGFISSTRELPVQDIDLFPTLVTYESEIHALLPRGSAIRSVMISDMMGRVVDHSSYLRDADIVMISMPSHLTPGMYVVTVRTEDGLFVGRIVKQ